MFIPFFFELRRLGVPVTLREFLSFLEALLAGVPGYRVEHAYHLGRTALVKDERFLDRYDRAFATCFEGLDALEDPFTAIPPEWLEKMGERWLSDEDKARVKELGGFSELIETLKKRLAEQEGKHGGGSKWIGTGGTSPFGAWGYNPFGIRIGQDRSRHRRAVKVWDRRDFADLDDDVEMGTRAFKLALRKLRRLGRDGAADEFDLDGTIRATARNAGTLDIAMQPSRRDRTKILLFLDVGGSMDDHVEAAEKLFSAASSEFRHLEHVYFHNCLYERVWRNNRRRWTETTPTEELFRTYGSDWRAVFVGDASMSPYEITEPGGSVEHWNEEAGVVWLRRAFAHWERSLWINPVPNEAWDWTHSIGMIRELTDDRMVPLTLEGLERGVRLLKDRR